MKNYRQGGNFYRETGQQRNSLPECYIKTDRCAAKMAGIRLATPMKEIPEEKIHAYYNLCRNLKLHITESNPYENAQVSAGGVDVREIKPTMESKICPGVYFAGEILDVDGRCGGYNLQWAWSSGYLAGYHAALA